MPLTTCACIVITSELINREIPGDCLRVLCYGLKYCVFSSITYVLWLERAESDRI